MALIAFNPLYMERVWGGRGLETKLGRSIPPERPIGESWEIVDRDDAQSVVADGPRAGQTFRELLEADPEAFLGPGADPAAPFPILVKWLDCQDRLSLQVHPPASIAPKLGGEPKTENWYIADAEPGAALLAGLRRGVTPESFRRALDEQRLEECVHRFEARPGDSLLVPSGRIHAIDAGNLILEIQQSSDTTYRVYDWGRAGLDGKPRQLHVEESLESIDFDDVEPAPLHPNERATTLADCAEFRIRKFDLAPGDPPLDLAAEAEPRLVHVVSGAIRDQADRREFGRGANCFQPYAEGSRLEAAAPATVLLTDRFARTTAG